MGEHGKTYENMGKDVITWNNMEKHCKTLENVVNLRKHCKHWKTPENVRKYVNHRKTWKP